MSNLLPLYNNPNLRCLRVDNGFFVLNGWDLQAAATRKKLRKLILVSEKIDSLKCLMNHPRLKRLRITLCGFLTMEDIKVVESMPRLTCVDIDYFPPRETGTQLDPVAVKSFAEFHINGNDKYALIENANPEKLEWILSLSLMRRVYALELAMIARVNSATREKLRLLPKLRELTFTSSSVSVKQVFRLLSSVTQLRRLHFCECVEITPKHYASLRKRFPSVELTYLT